MIASKFLTCIQNMPEESFNNFVTTLFEDEHVRTMIASTVNLPAAILNLLIEDTDWMVLRGVAQNPSLTKELLNKLTSSTLSMIKELETTLESHYDAHAKTQITNYIKVLVSIAKHNNTSNETLSKLLVVHNSKLFETIAENPNASAKLLDDLANIVLTKHLHWKEALAALVKNVNVQLVTITKIADAQLEDMEDYRSVEILSLISELSVTPSYLLAKIANVTLPVYDKFYEICESHHLLWHRCYLTLMALISNHNTPTSILAELTNTSRESHIFNAAHLELEMRKDS